MRVVPTELPGVVLVEPVVHRDPRGFFLETYQAASYAAHGIGPFVQDNCSRSAGGTLRGLHLQVAPHAQAKLIRVVEGSIYDVAVDVRRGSPTFGRFVGVMLSADAFKSYYIPAGFAHGFAVVSEVAQVEYKCSDVYDPACEIGIAWDDPAIGIDWPVAQPLLSERDRRHPLLASLTARLPLFESA